jgi:1-acyl-sn-glycerol-3-phosphate acyltransferase
VGAYYSATHFIVGKLFGILARWEVRGRQHIPRSGGMVVAANHISFWDPPLIGTALPREVFFLAKEERFTLPAWAWRSAASTRFRFGVGWRISAVCLGRSKCSSGAARC